MNVLESLREQVGLGGPSAQLANEVLVIYDNYNNGELTKEEFEFLMNEIATVRAQQDLANDEIACRWICTAVSTLVSLV